MPSKFKPIVMRPLATSIFDNRSNVDELAPGSWRWIQDFMVNRDGKLARAKGFVRAFHTTTNHDFHDQHVASALREPITGYFASTANNGRRRLFGMTKTRVVLLNESAGDWESIVSGLGQDGLPSLTQLRFNAAEIANKVVFTNDYDRVKYYDLDGSTFQDVDTLDVAGETGFLDVSKARRVIAWNDVILLLNTVEGGTRFASRIRWGDIVDKLEFRVRHITPAGNMTISDFQDLDYGHEILNAVPMASALYVFCDRSIWRCNFTVDTSVIGQESAALTCVRVYYEPRNKARCLVYPNTLVSNGRSAFYLGADGWYEYTPGQMAEPERPEWAHRSTKIIFDGPRAIDTTACASPVAEFRPDADTIYLSWPPVTPADDGLNDYTLAFNLKYKTSAYLDYGSVALVNFQSDLAGTGGCNNESKFLSSNSTDWIVKELLTGDSREMYNPVSGLYTQAGYYSILRFVFPFDRPMEEKEIKSFLAEIVADNPAEPAVAKLRLGTSDRVVEVNGENGDCRVLWHQLSNKEIKCSHTMSPEAYIAAGIRPAEPTVQWNYLMRGRFLFCELSLAAADGSPATTGSCAVSRFEVSARLLA